jgi:hypothetical protein
MGVLVLGMHRSGTSAVTAALAALGVPLCPPEERLAARPENAEGFHESRALTTFNEGLLGLLGGSWDAPPVIPTGPGLLAAMAPAAELFSQVHPTPTWVWKDPRLCLLAPVWLPVLPGDIRIVLVVRDPLAVARSLGRRDGMPKRQCLALWEHYTSSAISATAGRPALIVDYATVVRRPQGLADWTATLSRFVADEAVDGPDDPVAAVRACLRPELDHNDGDRRMLARDRDVSVRQQQLVHWLLERSGPHRAFAAA